MNADLPRRIDRKLLSTSPRPVRRPRFDEDTLVRALDYADESGHRFGQLIVNAVTEYLVANGAMTNQMTGDQKCAIVERTIFYMENSALQAAIKAYVDKHRAQHEALGELARQAVADGTYDVVPPCMEQTA